MDRNLHGCFLTHNVLFVLTYLFSAPSKDHSLTPHYLRLDAKWAKIGKIQNFDLEIWHFDLEDELRNCWKWHYRTRRPQKSLYGSQGRISSPSIEVTL